MFAFALQVGALFSWPHFHWGLCLYLLRSAIGQRRAESRTNSVAARRPSRRPGNLRVGLDGNTAIGSFTSASFINQQSAQRAGEDNLWEVELVFSPITFYYVGYYHRSITTFCKTVLVQFYIRWNYILRGDIRTVGGQKVITEMQKLKKVLKNNEQCLQQ